MDYGHHWHNCKKGNTEDIAAMRAIRGPPKKRTRTTKSAQSSIVPIEDEAPAATMSFPPSQSLEPTPKKKRKCVDSSSEASKSHSIEISSKKRGKYGDSNSGPSKRSRSGSNQPEPFPIEVNAKTIVKTKKKVKAKANNKKTARGGAKNGIVLFDSPAMATRSKVAALASPAKATRSKRRISL